MRNISLCIYSPPWDVPILKLSFQIMHWTLYHGPPLYQIYVLNGGPLLGLSLLGRQKHVNGCEYCGHFKTDNNFNLYIILPKKCISMQNAKNQKATRKHLYLTSSLLNFILSMPCDTAVQERPVTIQANKPNRFPTPSLALYLLIPLISARIRDSHNLP